MDNYTRVLNFIHRGEELAKTENLHPGGPLTVVSGSNYETWINEIQIFNERYLKTHPLYQSISSTCFHRKNINAYTNMMGHLRALANDRDFFGISEEDPMASFRSKKTIGQLLAEDIEQCKTFLNEPYNESEGKRVYLELTGRYDTIIEGLGNGLYGYYPDLHFYDSVVGRDSLIHNITLILNKMVSYQAKYYPPISEPSEKKVKEMSDEVFIVHGHDNEAKQEMARTLERWGFRPVILHEQPDSGMTIIEKIEKYSDVCYAVILYTECDCGRDKNTSVDKERYRARQNVVFEHGYLIAKLGRNRVSAFVKGNVETPGDIGGVVYIPMDNAGAWKMNLAKNMKGEGIDVDMNKTCL